MASIISKKVNGQTYYYLRQMARVDGKPKMAWERYLGKAEDIEAAVAGSTAVPERTRHLAFGDLAATWSVIKRLRIAEIVDEVVGPRRADASASVGTYIALMVLNRVVAPCSKLGFGDWWATTAGDRLAVRQVDDRAGIEEPHGVVVPGAGPKCRPDRRRRLAGRCCRRRAARTASQHRYLPGQRVRQGAPI